MATWHLKELKDLVRARLQREDYERAKVLIDSVAWKINAEKFHIRQAVEVFEPFFPGGEVDTDKAMRLAFASTEDAARFGYAVSAREYSLVSAVTTAHTTPELIVQLAAFLFVSPRPDVHALKFPRSLELLPSSTFKDSLIKLSSLAEYQYIDAFSNTVKHVALVVPQFHISFEDEEYHGVKFKEFEYRARKYGAKTDSELMQCVRTLREHYVEAGSQISAALR